MSIFLFKTLFFCYFLNLNFGMINYLISEKIRLKRSYILKGMNFLIFRDFSRKFWNFFEFILI